MQSIYILIAIVLGILIPQAHTFTWLIQYSLLIMLFFAFLGVGFRRDLWHRNHFRVLAINLVLPVVLFFLFRLINRDLALAVFVISMAPTAAGAPVIADLLRSKVAFVTGSVLLTSPLVAIVLPLLLPGLLPVEGKLSVGEILLPVALLIFIPLVISQSIRRFLPRLAITLLPYRKVAFYLFLFNVFLGCARASQFIRYENQTATYLLPLMGLATGLLCLLQFQLGERISGGHLPVACSLALGRKNTMFGLWVALTFVGPVAAMGPIFYIIFQNMYNSWQMHQMERGKLARG